MRELSRELGCKVVEISALKGTGIMDAAEAAIDAAKNTKTIPMHTFSGCVEHTIAHIEGAAVHSMPEEQQRWYAIKIFERDDKVLSQLNIDQKTLAHIGEDQGPKRAGRRRRKHHHQRALLYIASIIKSCYKKRARASSRPPTKSIRSSRTVGSACRSLRSSCSSSTTSRWSRSVRLRPTGQRTACSATVTTFFGIGTADYEENADAYGEAMNAVDAFIGTGAEGADALSEALDTESDTFDPAAAKAALDRSPPQFAAAGKPTSTSKRGGPLHRNRYIHTGEDLAAAAPTLDGYGFEGPTRPLGVWVPGIPVLIGDGLAAANTPEWLNG